MTRKRDVVTLKIPFPNISQNLARQPHMYLCLQEGKKKRFLSCQTAKPQNLAKNRPPYKFVDEKNDLSRNPFRRRTLIACDYYFKVDDVHIHNSLLTKKRRDVCEELFDKVVEETKHNSFHGKSFDMEQLLALNPKVEVRV